MADRSAAALVPLLLFGCPGEPEPAACGAGQPEVWVIQELTFARRADGVVEGFDLDGLTSAADDADGCGHADLVDPEGQSGIDNNFSAIIPILEVTEAVAAESLVKQSIASGELLLLLELGGLDGWESDACVDFGLLRGVGDPLVGPDGTLLDHQTLALDPGVAPARASGAVVDGELEAAGLSFRLPLDVLNAELDFEVTRGRFEVRPAGAGRVKGVMGGVIPIRQIVEILERDDVNLSQFAPIVAQIADVRDEAGDCSLLSLAFEFEAIPAYLPPDDTGG